MDSLVVFPDNHQQFVAIKSFLEDMKVRFKSQKTEIKNDFLPSTNKEKQHSISLAENDISAGRVFSMEEMRNRRR